MDDLELKEFNIEHERLLIDLKNHKLSYREADERCNKLIKLIPFNYDINTVRLNILMKEQFGNHPEWYCSKTFFIKN